MADYNARVLPFINTVAYVTAKAGVYPGGGYHSGLDLSTGTGNKGANLYSICNGTVINKGFQSGGYGNYIIIKDNDSDYAFLFGHMFEASPLNIGDTILIGQQFGIEGATGNVTGLHTHIEMQNYLNNGNRWINNPSDESLWGTVYLDVTSFLGIPNELGISVYYDGIPIPYKIKKNSIKWLKAKTKKIYINY